MWQRLWAIGCLAALALAGGCAGKPTPPAIVPVEGTVVLDGKPLNKVVVKFIPVGDFGPEYMAMGETDDKGRFKLICKGQPGACACENHVIVSEMDIPSKYLGESEKAQAQLRAYLEALGPRPPKKYRNVAESPLHVIVTAERKDYPLQLVRE